MKRIDVRAWEPFELGQLFEVVKGTRLTKADMRPGDIRFIGSSSMNNGLTQMISNNEHIHPSNTLTVCYNGSVGETFYQDSPFWASDDVNVLYPKFEMNVYIGLFIAPLIKSVSKKYNFVDKWKQKTMKKEQIRLPIKETGKPDFAYMEEYMRVIMENAEVYLDYINQIIG